ncbi:MAG: zinc metalloprotease [Phycisphaerae bacterium]
MTTNLRTDGSMWSKLMARGAALLAGAPLAVAQMGADSNLASQTAAETAIVATETIAGFDGGPDDLAGIGVPFTIEGMTWADQKTFIDAGGRCGTEPPSADELDAVEALQLRTPGRPPGSVPVNVYWHVIRRGTALSDGNISNKQINQSIAAMNRAYAGANGGVPTPFTFVLAGITRTTNNAWFNMQKGSLEEAAAKRRLHVGTVSDLNVYSCAGGGLLGWSVFPWNAVAHLDQDGVVILYSSVPGGTAVPYNEGDTLVHEVGHWLGLLHTFENGCAQPGDFVSDTPYEATPAFGCPVNRDTCPNIGLDPTSNYMDYVDDPCMNQFTDGQATRMDAQSLLRALF